MNIDDLKTLMKKKKISYSKLSANTNIPVSTIKAIFSGKTENPRLDTLKSICAFLDSDINRLYYNEITTEEGQDNDITELIKNYKKLSEKQKKHIRINIYSMLEETDKLKQEISKVIKG